MAICETTSSLPKPSRLGPPVVLPRLVRVGEGAGCSKRNAGARPNRTPVTRHTARVNTKTRQSGRRSKEIQLEANRTSMTTGPDVAVEARTFVPQTENSNPAKPAIDASSRLSVMSWRTMRKRPAPIARRTAISRCRAQLAQAGDLLRSQPQPGEPGRRRS